MASPVVQEAIESNTTSAGTNHVVTLPTATAGQLLLIILDKGSTAATIDAHASLTELLDENLANGLYVAYRQMDGTEPASYTLVSSASTRSAHIAYRISGAADPATQAPEIGTTGSGSSATPDPPSSAAPAESKDFLFVAFYGAAGEEADDDTWSDTPPTNYTPSPPRQKACGVAGTNLGGLLAAAERALTTGTAENPGTFAKDTSAAWRSQTIMVHPAASVLVTPGTASLTTALFAPTVTATDNQTVTPGTAALVTARFTPTVTATANVSVTPGIATLTTTAFAPAVTVGVRVVPGIATLATATFAPSVTTTANVTVTPGIATLVTTRFTPSVTVSDNQTVTPGIASLVTVRFAPTVTVTAPTFTSYGLPLLFTAVNWGSVSIYLEAYVRATAGTVLARLYDDTAGAAVDGSEVSSASGSFVRLRSSALTLTDGNTYRLQFGRVVSAAGEFLGGKLVIV